MFILLLQCTQMGVLRLIMRLYHIFKIYAFWVLLSQECGLTVRQTQ